MRGSAFFSGLATFLAATAAALVFPLGWWDIAWVTVVGVLLAVSALVLRTKYGGRIILIACICVVAMVRVAVMSPLTHPHADAHLGDTVQLTGVIQDQIDEREASAHITVFITHINGETVPTAASLRALVAVAPHPAASYGDTVVVEGVLGKPEVFKTDAGRLFDYPQYLAVSGIGYTVRFAYIVETKNGGASMRRTLYEIKDVYLEGLGQALIEPYAALAGGLTVGDKRALGGELLDTFRDSGIVHIVVLSGFNITIIVAFLLGWLRDTDKRAQLTLGVVVIVAFVLMTGASATGVRAGVMAALALMATALSRQYVIIRALGITAGGMVLWNPRILLWDPGFQLSIIATIGLISVAPLIAQRLMWLTERCGVREIVASTIGTQIAVLPLLIYQIGEISLVALPANVLVLPIVPFAMLLASFAGVSGMIGVPFAAVVGYPAHLLLQWIVFVAEKAAAAPYATITMPSMPLWLVLGIYTAAMIWLVRRSNDSPRHSNLDS
ncbi:MAG: ComEC/Rec2 family competence protein [Candidatus Pacebacteria bacterium]|nr:ComEC/Rec2 family competence protein [Candidatus Paceibacterota bacterium]